MREIQQIFRLMVNREILQEILFLLISFLLSTYLRMQIKVRT